MTRDNEIANAALEAMTETLMSTPNYEFSPKATDLLECAYIKGAEWADKHPANPWHSVADGDLPKEDVFENNMLIVYGAGIGFEYDVQYVKENGGAFGFYTPAIGFNEIDDFSIIEGVEYWMEMPEVKEKER